MTGRIHSIQTLGTVDGPGVRAVIFLQGCPLRCAYCHNPDTWDPKGGEEVSGEDVANRILRLKAFYQKGGVTVSGGEPLMQGAFVNELFSLFKENGLHTALDTSGIGTVENIDLALKNTDLVMCDLKFPAEELMKKHTGASLEKVLAFLKETEKRDIPLWIRHVVVPFLTDSDESVREIVRIAKSFRNLKKIELLPFKKICISKYDQMKIPFPLRETPACPLDTIKRLEKLI